MKLNPLDIRRQQFAKKTFGGYDQAEVDGFVKQIADQWEDVLDESRSASERVQELENKLRHYERVEMALQEALETARESGRRSEAMADQKAKLIIEDAEMRARQILQDAERDRHGMRQDLVKLTSRQTEIGARLRGFLLSELEILAQFQGDDPVGFIKLQPAWPNGAPDDQGALEAAPEAPRLAPRPAPEEPAPALTEEVPADEPLADGDDAVARRDASETPTASAPDGPPQPGGAPPAEDAVPAPQPPASAPEASEAAPTVRAPEPAPEAPPAPA
ncbi:MAG TPA: DivIVA domain-containing protein, partial [Rubricoccaceae bacterium]